MTVLYCIIKSTVPPDLPPAGGLPGAAAPRAVALGGDLAAIVASLPEGGYKPDVVEARLRDMDWVSKAALGHEQLLESVMRSARAVIPMKLLTLFSGDERLIADLSKQRRRLERTAAAVEGCEEYGLRVVALDSATAESISGPPPSGTAFLERKKQIRDTARDQAARRAAFAREAFDTLAKAARDAVSRPAQNDDVERPVLDAAFLVAADQRQAFGRAADALAARAAGAHCLFKLTGPWPPYHFVQIDHAS